MTVAEPYIFYATWTAMPLPPGVLQSWFHRPPFPPKPGK